MIASALFFIAWAYTYNLANEEATWMKCLMAIMFFILGFYNLIENFLK